MAIYSSGAGSRVFISYPRNMELEANALRNGLEVRGWNLGFPPSESVNAQESINVAFADVRTFVVLVPLEGANTRLQRSEVSLILEKAWADSDVRVAVVAPAVGAIPAALRHRPFVTYYPHDEVRLDKWKSDPTTVEYFLDLLFQHSDTPKPPQQSDEDEDVRQWRNRLVHLGRNEVEQMHAKERERLLEALQRDVGLASQAYDAGAAWSPERLLDRILLSEALGERELAEGFYQSMASDTSDDINRTAATADMEYSRALAAYEVGYFEEAHSRFAQAAAINERVRGGTDPRTVASLYNAALAAAKVGDTSGAKVTYQRALELSQQGLGSNHPQTATIAFNLALLNASSGDNVEAVRLLELAKDAYRQVTPPDSPELAAVVHELNRLGA